MGLPQPPQYRLADSFTKAQAGQARGRPTPQFMQNRRAGLFSAPHCRHLIGHFQDERGQSPLSVMILLSSEAAGYSVAGWIGKSP
jgi:hypothetical protein